MKLSTLFVGVSLTLNAVLLAALSWNIFSPSAASSALAPKADVAVSPAKVSAEPDAAAEAWTELQVGDLAAQAERLRAEGFPPAMTRAIMTAQIRAQFAVRRKALERASGATPFWETSNPDPKLAAEQRALAKEEQKALRDLLGPDPENGMAARLRRSYPDLSPEKIDQMAEVRERYDEKRSDLYATMRNTYLSDDGKKIDALDKAQRAELATVLSPPELEAYDLRESRTANSMRSNLAAFDPTESEYRMLFRLQSAFDDQFGQMGQGASPEEMRARSEGQKALTEQIKEALGEGRYAEYQRASDYNYRRTTWLVARLNLPPETANELYAVQLSTQQRLADLRRPGQPPLPAAERQAQLAALAAEAEAKITAKLGPAGFEAYKQNSGSWLSNLAPPRPATPKQ